MKEMKKPLGDNAVIVIAMGLFVLIGAAMGLLAGPGSIVGMIGGGLVVLPVFMLLVILMNLMMAPGRRSAEIYADKKKAERQVYSRAHPIVGVFTGRLSFIMLAISSVMLVLPPVFLLFSYQLKNTLTTNPDMESSICVTLLDILICTGYIFIFVGGLSLVFTLCARKVLRETRPIEKDQTSNKSMDCTSQ
jgi:hypothetical protein